MCSSSVPIVGDVIDVAKDVGDFIQDEVIDPVKEVGRDIDDFVNEEIPGGWYTVGAAAGGAALASGAVGGAAAGTGAAGGVAGGTGLTAGAGGVTGLTAGAGGVTGITAGTGATLGGAIGGGLGGAGVGSLLDAGTSVAGMEGALGSGLAAESAGLGLTAPTAPALSSMGGGTGLLAPAAGGGGLIGATGLTAAGAVPILGDAASIINQPAVLGTDVINYVAPSNALKTSLDTMRAVNSLRNLLGQPTAPIPQMQRQMIQPSGAVQYPSLDLLAMRPIQRQSLI
jgi:hypothetical protein